MRPFDETGLFVQTSDRNSFRRATFRGAASTLLSSFLGLLIQIIATVVLARLLTPADFGLVTMVTTFSLLLMSFGSNGFNEAVLQRPTLDRFLTSNLFWINLGAGVLLTIGFAGGGVLLARFYGNPNVTPVAAWMSLRILIASTAVLHQALLRRGMRFTSLSRVEVAAKIASVIISILLGLRGWGYWSLVGGAIAQSLIQSVSAWFLCRWIPSLPRRVVGTASMVRFALNIYAGYSLNYFARNLDNVLVGWRFDAQALGFYKKAYDLFALSTEQLVTPLSLVAQSALSRLNKDLAEYRRSFLRVIELLAFVGMGLGAFLSLIGKDLIRVLLGPGWEASGQIFIYFGPGIGVMLLYYTSGWIHVSIGRADRWFRWGVVEFLATTILFIIGLPWGPAGIAVAWTVSFWTLTLPSLWYAGRPIQFRVSSVLNVSWRYLASSAVAVAASVTIIAGFHLASTRTDFRGAISRIAVTSILFWILYLATVILLHRGYAPLSRVVRILQTILAVRQGRTAEAEMPRSLPLDHVPEVETPPLGTH